MRATTCIALAAAAAAPLVVGCGGADAGRQAARAEALVDSVAALADVTAYAQLELGRARKALAEGDSLAAVGDRATAAKRFAEAVIFARLAVVISEQRAGADTSSRSVGETDAP